MTPFFRPEWTTSRQRLLRRAAIGLITLAILSPVFITAWRAFANLALISASQKGDLKAIKFYIRAGASPRTAEDGGQTALIAAVQGRKPGVIRFLVAHGADVEARGPFGNTALLSSVGEGVDTVRMLLDQGAEVDARDDRGQTLFLYAAENADVQITKVLLMHGANVNVRNREGRTPLMQAACIDYPVNAKQLEDTVQILIAHKADISLQDNTGETALTLAKRYGHGDVERVIRKSRVY